MANFLKQLVSIAAGAKQTITLYGGGPPPGNERLDVFPVTASDQTGQVSVKFKTLRPGSYYDWEITGKHPGKVKLNAKVPSTGQIYSAPMDITVTGKINIIFKSNGEGTIECVGLGTFPILGRPGIKYPRDITVTEADKKGTYHSKKYNVDMPFAILIWGQEGIYIHQFPDNLQENGGPSAGCIHVSRRNAPKVYEYVAARTAIKIKYPW
ncbi:MAG: L,D-transpeptidase [Microcystis aeruginosa F13-15]|nr:L,D-transpeptidase [Microcystis aeruginosa F13-15]